MTTINQNEIILSALREKLGEGSLVCPISGPQTTWSVQRQTTVLPALDSPLDSVFLNNASFPFAVVTCDHCGYTFLVNLIKLGLAEQFQLPVQSE